jgi:hypothetical protein
VLFLSVETQSAKIGYRIDLLDGPDALPEAA